MRRALVVLAACAGVAGCSAAGEPQGDVTWSKAGVPFTFDYPSKWTKAPVDAGNTRGDVVGAVGLTKVDVIAVRRTGSFGAKRLIVLGHEVTSDRRAVPGHPGWALECQYTPDFRAEVLKACRGALRSIRAK